MALHPSRSEVISWDTVETMRGTDSQKPNCICGVRFIMVGEPKNAQLKKKF